MDKAIDDVEKAIRDYLPKIAHLSLATSRDNRPWVCEVHYVYDDKLNLYFRSKLSRRHSQEILANPSVAGNIVMQHALDQKPRGVYFEGEARVMTDQQDIQEVYALFADRLHIGPEVLEDAKREDGHKFFRITVHTYYMFDTIESSPARKYELQWADD